MTKAGTDQEIIEGEFVEAPGRRLRRLLPWILIGLLAAFIGGLFAAPAIERSLQSLGLLAAPETPAPQPPSADPQTAEMLAALRTRIAALETALLHMSEDLAAAAAESSGQGGGEASVPGLDALAGRIAALEAITADLSVAIAPGDEAAGLGEAVVSAAAERARMAAQLAALDRRLAALEAIDRDTGSAVPMLAAHLIALGERLDHGAPFADRLTLLESEVLALPAGLRVGLGESLVRLHEVASTGVASRSTLAAEFDSLAFELVRARPAPADEGFLAGLGRRLGSIFVVRRTGELPGEGVEALIARAEAALRRGDLAAAVGELSALDPASRAPAENWLATARERLAAEAALATLISGLAPAGQVAGSR